MPGDFGEVYLLDWGIAKELTTASRPTLLDDLAQTLRGATQMGDVLGTPGYMAPEQIQGSALAGKRAEDRRRRFAAIAEAAARQCRSPSLPEVSEIADLSHALATVDGATARYILWEQARGCALRQALPAETPECIALAIGPEGGFTAREAAEATESGWIPVGLGPRILRSETAALAAAVLVAAAVGNLD